MTAHICAILVLEIALASVSLQEPDNVQLVTKKCCPVGQFLDIQLECLDIESEQDLQKYKYSNEESADTVEVTLKQMSPKYFPVPSGWALQDKQPWFPFDAILNGTTLGPVTDRSVVERLFSNVIQQYGETPACPSEERDTACFKKHQVAQFKYILHPKGELELYVGKLSSYHDENYFGIEKGRCSVSRNGSTTVSSTTAGDAQQEWDSSSLRTFPMADVCTDLGPQGNHIAIYCPCNAATCVRKCCPDGQVFDVSGDCVHHKGVPNWRPYMENGSLPRNYYLLTNTNPSTCDHPSLLKVPNPEELEVDTQRHCFSPSRHIYRNEFQFSSNGSVLIRKYNFPVLTNAYCGEHTLYPNMTYVENNLIICLQQGDVNPVKFKIYGGIMLVGGFVLFLTVAISLYLPELRTSVYYKTIICHNIALMIASFAWGTSNLLPPMSYPVCVFFSLLIQFTFLGSFFWMNIMCIDISLAFRSVRAASGSSVKSGTKFTWYSLYAWGAPSLITVVTAAMEFAPNVPFEDLRPGFWCHNCGFNSETSAILIYFYGPMILILIFNTILFVLTIIRIFQIQRETKILNGKGNWKRTSAFNSDKQRLILFSKLFLLMGLTWVTEIVSWAVGGPSYYWYIPDIINFLRAFFIFVIFICKRTVICSLLSKLGLHTWANAFDNRKSSAASSRLSETSFGRNRRSKSSSTERQEAAKAAEIERRGRILQKQITQTIRDSSDESQL